MKLEKEDAEAFHLNDGKASFKVAKKGLTPQLHGQIAQHFAKGGEVKGYYAGDAIPDPDKNYLGGFGTSPPADTSSVDPATAKGLNAIFGAKPDAGGTPDLEQMRAPVQTGGETNQSSPIPSWGQAWQDTKDKVGQLLGDPGAALATPKAPDETLAASAPAGLPSMSAPKPVSVPGGNAPGVLKDLASSAKEEQAAEQGKADIATRQADELLGMQQKRATQEAALTKEWADKYNANQANGQKVYEDIASSKIDPNQFWHSKGTANKIGSIAAIVLGGLAQGIGHTSSNGAMDIVNKATDNDIQAQKDNLGKKQSQLGYYMQQGHNIQEAGKLAKADSLDAYAGQVQQLATKYAGPLAQNQAAKEVAESRKQSAMLREQVHSEGLSNSIKGLDIAEKRAQLGMMGQQSQLLSALGRGVHLTPEQEANLPPQVAERLVKLSDGTATLARDKESAKSVQESISSSDEVRQKLRTYAASIDEWKKLPGTEANARATEQYNSILSEMGKLHGLQRLTEPELELFKKQLPDVTSLFQKDSTARAKLESLGAAIDGKVANYNKNYLTIGNRPMGNQNVIAR